MLSFHALLTITLLEAEKADRDIFYDVLEKKFRWDKDGDVETVWTNIIQAESHGHAVDEVEKHLQKASDESGLDGKAVFQVGDNDASKVNFNSDGFKMVSVEVKDENVKKKSKAQELLALTPGSKPKISDYI